ncbi:MATE family efflux transporter [Vallitalea guaymasensis]|uniref:MATE family efflux transporter n=1 Tax=Vallitalea guaymasensis TaxID=1185412 RepID=UPI00235361E1|nr:MATE family efflux transporter [Vallitalea guaymasensis]
MNNHIKTDTLTIKEINKMAIPLIFNSVIGMLIGLIDTAMIGRISLDAFGAVGLISTTINSITGVLGAIAIAFNIAGAKNKGEGNTKGLIDNFLSGILTSLIIGLSIWFILLGFGNRLLQMIFGLEDVILQESISYMNLFGITICLNMMLFMFSSLFKIINTTKYLFIGNITATITNVILNYILIFGKLGFEPMAVRGAGIASVISLVLNIVIYISIIYIKKLLIVNDILSIDKMIKNGVILLKNSLALMGQEILESTILVICINAILSRIGVLELSIYTLLSSIVSIVLMPMYSYASTALTLVSKNYGQKQYGRLLLIPKYSLKLAMIFCISLSAILIIFKVNVVTLITNDYNLISYSLQYFMIALCSCLFNIPNNIYKYSLQGIGDDKWVLLNSAVINVIGIGFIWFLSIALEMGIYGVYIGITFNYIILSFSNNYRFNHRIVLYSEKSI